MRAWFQILLRSQPLLPAATVFIGGIFVSRMFDPGPAILLGSLILGVILRRYAGSAFLLFILGAIIYWCRYAAFSEHDLRVLLTEEPAIVTLRGDLSESPQVREISTSEYSTARLRVTEILLNERWQPARGEVMTRTRGILDDDPYFQGRRVEISGVIRPPTGAQAPGLFDYKQYLKNNRIFFQFNADSPSDWKILEPQPMPWMERLRRWAKWQLSRGLPEDEQVQMLWAMTLGWKTALSGEMAEPFMRTGTMHIFAISGLHVACIAGMLVFALQMLGISRHHCACLVIPLVWFYTIASGWQSSGVRSALMSTALIGGWSLKRPTALLNSLAASALLILIFQPEQLFQAGFQLSFAVVMSIALLAPVLEQRVGAGLPHDPLLPRELRPPWQQWLERTYRFVRPSIIVTAACFIGSLPLTAYYFNLFSPISLIANLVAVPISSLALLFSMLSLVLFPLGELWNFFSWAFMWETIVVARAFEAAGGYFYVPRPGIAFFLFYIALALSLVRGWLWQKGIRPWANSIVLLLGLWWGLAAKADPSIHILPSPGTPVWVDFPGAAHDLLIDCSNERGFEYSVQRFLRAQGVGVLPNLVLTHGDIEHVGGFLTALNEFKPGKIFTGPHPSRSPAYRGAWRILDRLPDKWKRIQRGESIHAWQVLHPPLDEKFSRADDNAVVLKTEINGWRVLFVGDLAREGQRSLLNAKVDLSADLVIVGSSADRQPLLESFVHRISPAIAVLGDETHLASSSALIFQPERDGAVSVGFSRGECRVSTMNGRRHVLVNAGRNL